MAATRLLDATVVGGDEAVIAARVQEHRDAGADHVAVQVLGREAYRGLPADDWRRLARADFVRFLASRASESVAPER